MSENPNYYNIIGDKYGSGLKTYQNYDNVKIQIPLRLLIIGAGGSNKTNSFLNLFSSMKCFDRIYLCVKMPDEPLYKYFIDKCRETEDEINKKLVKLKAKPIEYLTICETIEDIPPVDTFDSARNNLILFDDMIGEKDKLLENVATIYNRGRKRNISTFFISQSYFKIPLLIRQNTDYIMLLRFNDLRDLKRTLGIYGDEKLLLKLYNQSQFQTEEDKKNKNIGKPFFLIDLKTTDDNLKFRRNFIGIS